ncbi:hypothetical protein BMS3Bbin01_00830 [bacterium BMS3Bbin01]|nr:hypothetical protein BMS3Bbin01_00830 [bacterium BMS3Bbin01]
MIERCYAVVALMLGSGIFEDLRWPRAPGRLMVLFIHPAVRLTSLARAIAFAVWARRFTSLPM